MKEVEGIPTISNVYDSVEINQYITVNYHFNLLIINKTNKGQITRILSCRG